MILEQLETSAAEFERATGWALKREGACKGTVCVPLPPRVHAGSPGNERVDVEAVAGRLGMPLVHDDVAGVWALGPESAITGRALTTAAAPDLELPDFDGNPFRLSSLLGQKVLLVSWASW